MNILVTGGAGYIGSHTCVELLEAGYEVIVADNLSNSKEESLRRVENITGKRLTFHKVDLLDREALSSISCSEIRAVIHFRAQGGRRVQSVPLRYYHNNTGTLILSVMMEHGVRNMVFSSSATVYGTRKSTHRELHGRHQLLWRSKLMIEVILWDLHASDAGWNIALLRYSSRRRTCKRPHRKDPERHSQQSCRLSPRSPSGSYRCSAYSAMTIHQRRHRRRDLFMWWIWQGHIHALKSSSSARESSRTTWERDRATASGRWCAHSRRLRQKNPLPDRRAEAGISPADPSSGIGAWMESTARHRRHVQDSWKWQSLNPTTMREVSRFVCRTRLQAPGEGEMVSGLKPIAITHQSREQNPERIQLPAGERLPEALSVILTAIENDGGHGPVPERAQHGRAVLVCVCSRRPARLP